MNAPQRFPRRDLLRAASAAAAAPYLLPSGVLARDGKPGAAERLTLAHVGVGGMGGGHLRMSLEFRKLGACNIAAVCEVDEGRLASATKKDGPGCTP